MRPGNDNEVNGTCVDAQILLKLRLSLRDVRSEQSKANETSERFLV